MTALLEARGVKRLYPVRSGGKRGHLHAVAGVDLAIAPGESVGIVGESGCGKSTLARLIARLIDVSDGDIIFKGRSIAAIPLARFIAAKERAAIQMVFQDPTESLNPSLTVGDAIADPLRRLLKIGGRAEIETRVHKILDDVGLPRSLVDRYPHQLSGGQKARVGIGRAIAAEPELLILDEPTSALDVSVQAVILKLLAELRARRNMAYVFVSHDLNVVRLVCERVVVMYLGEIVEIAPARALFDAALHPYTRALVAAIPDPARRGRKTARLDGSPRSPIDPDPNVCAFYGRCPVGQPICAQAKPALRALPGGRFAACHFVEVESERRRADGVVG